MAETTGLLNRRTGITCTAGSNPASSAFRDVAQPGSAPALGAGGPRFESWYPDTENQGVTLKNVTPNFFGLQCGLHCGSFSLTITEMLKDLAGPSNNSLRWFRMPGRILSGIQRLQPATCCLYSCNDIQAPSECFRDIPVILPLIPSIIIPMLLDSERIKLVLSGGFRGA